MLQLFLLASLFCISSSLRVVNVTAYRNENGAGEYTEYHLSDRSPFYVTRYMPAGKILTLRRGRTTSIVFEMQQSLPLGWPFHSLLVEPELLETLVSEAASANHTTRILTRFRELNSGQIYGIDCMHETASGFFVTRLPHDHFELVICGGRNRGVKTISNNERREMTSRSFALVLLTGDLMLVTDIQVQAKPSSGTRRQAPQNDPAAHLKRLESDKLEDIPDKPLAADLDNCAICTAPLKQDLRAVKGCRHEFHADCINRWLAVKLDAFSCPYCRHRNS